MNIRHVLQQKYLKAGSAVLICIIALAVYLFAQSGSSYAALVAQANEVAGQDSNPDRALLLIGKAIKAEPKNPEAYTIKATYLISAERFEEALPEIDMAISIQPLMHRYFLQGEALNGLERRAEALAAYEKARELGDGFAPLYERLAFIYNYLKEPEKALEASKMCIVLEDANFDCWAHKSMAEYSQHDCTAAGASAYHMAIISTLPADREYADKWLQMVLGSASCKK